MMKRINFENLRERNDYFIDKFIGGMKMEFIKHGNNYIIKNSNGVIVSEEEKLKLEKKELVIKDVESNSCQQDTTKKISEINKELEKTGGIPAKKKTKKIKKAETKEEVSEDVKDTISTIRETDETI